MHHLTGTNMHLRQSTVPVAAIAAKTAGINPADPVGFVHGCGLLPGKREISHNIKNDGR